MGGGAVSHILLRCRDTSPQDSFKGNFHGAERLIQLSAIPAFLPTITAFLTRYLVNKDVVEVIGEAARKFVSQVRKQVLLLLHS